MYILLSHYSIWRFRERGKILDLFFIFFGYEMEKNKIKIRDGVYVGRQICINAIQYNVYTKHNFHVR